MMRGPLACQKVVKALMLNRWCIRLALASAVIKRHRSQMVA